jgi:hypothetical protein
MWYKKLSLINQVYYHLYMALILCDTKLWNFISICSPLSAGRAHHGLATIEFDCAMVSSENWLIDMEFYLIWYFISLSDFDMIFDWLVTPRTIIGCDKAELPYLMKLKLSLNTWVCIWNLFPFWDFICCF